MKYGMEQKKLLALLDSGVWDLFAEYGAVIAGGAITSIFTNKEVNDIDVYLPSEEALFRVVAGFYCQEDYVKEECLSSFQVMIQGTSQRTIMCSNNGQEIQLMTFKYFPEIQDIFNTFDFTACMGAYDCKSKEFVLHDDFLQHNAQRYLKFNTGTDYPIMSLMRVDKYRERGYTISKSEMLRVLFSCMSLKLRSWGDVKEHVGGMYGYDMSKAFDEEQIFTFDELIDQLDTIHERNAVLYSRDHKSVDFETLCKDLFYHPEEILEVEDPKFDDSKYLYKCVDKDWKSPIYSGNNAVKYTQGDIIVAPYNGLYFHGNSIKPYHETDYWVECELLSGDVVTAGYGNAEKRVVNGSKLKVVRTFKYKIPSGKEHMNWIDKKYTIDHDTPKDEFKGIPF
jgi:hypothetical protein